MPSALQDILELAASYQGSVSSPPYQKVQQAYHGFSATSILRAALRFLKKRKRYSKPPLQTMGNVQRHPDLSLNPEELLTLTARRFSLVPQQNSVSLWICLAANAQVHADSHRKQSSL